MEFPFGTREAFGRTTTGPGLGQGWTRAGPGLEEGPDEAPSGRPSSTPIHTGVNQLPSAAAAACDSVAGVTHLSTYYTNLHVHHNTGCDIYEDK